MKPDRYHDVGNDRVAESGRPLGGTYERSLCCYDLYQGKKIDAEEILFEEFIVKTNNSLVKHKSFFKEVRESGGKVDYFVGWFSNGSCNMNIYLDDNLMKLTSELGISIVLCAYPDPE